MLLAQNGANVIKVEPPGGDWGRAIGRQYGDFCAYNVAFNRGKRSLSVDLKSPFGLNAVRRAMERADVVVENYRPGVLQRFGLDYETLTATNPDVVYVSVTGYGQVGPRAKLPATDSILQAYAGLMSANRGESDGMPQRIGVLVIDVVTGLYAFQAVTTALYKRALRGGGKHISVSLMDSIGAVQAGKMIEFSMEGDHPAKAGVPVATYELQDGVMTINARREPHFRRLCEILACEEFIDDPRFVSNAVRLEHESELLPTLRERVKSWTVDALSAELTRADILHGPVNTYGDYLADEHVTETKAVHWMEHSELGRIPIHAIPGLEFASEGPRAASPRIGEDSVAVLQALGLNPSAIEAAITDGAVCTPSS
jgi:crotonobetainyl-CoA:carnitine CoA-transferase CaiB-like acyl-CoA transferase